MRITALSAIVALAFFLTRDSGAQPLTIAPGYLLKITVVNHPEFSQTVVVRSDGTTEYPLLPGVPVEGLTVGELRSLLITALLRYEREPEVFVVISEARMIKVDIFGAVNRPMRIEAPAPLNLQQALQIAGGTLPDADLSQVRILRQNSPNRVEQVYDFTTYFRTDNPQITPELEDGDMVIVPRASPQSMIRVIGEVHSPGNYLYIPGEDLFDLIVRSGGLNDNANAKKVQIIHSNGEKKVVNFTQIIKKGGDFPKVLPGDVVVIPSREEWRRFSYWATLVYHFSILASSLVILSRL